MILLYSQRSKSANQMPPVQAKPFEEKMVVSMWNWRVFFKTCFSALQVFSPWRPDEPPQSFILMQHDITSYK